jgi:hypothetical protein
MCRLAAYNEEGRRNGEYVSEDLTYWQQPIIVP